MCLGGAGYPLFCLNEQVCLFIFAVDPLGGKF